MNDEQICALLRELFLQGDDDFPLDADTDLLEEGICDSLGMVRLAARIEKVAGIKIADQDITRDNFRSLRTIERYVARRRGA